MTTVISRVYADRDVAQGVADNLIAAGFRAGDIDLIGPVNDAAEAMIAARVPKPDVPAYSAVMTGAASLLVVRAGFNPVGAARQAMALMDAVPSAPVDVPTQNVYIIERAKAQSFLSVMTSHPRFLTNDLRSGDDPQSAPIGHIFAAPAIWRRKPRSAAGKAGFMSQRIIPFPLLSNRGLSDSAIRGGKRFFYNSFGDQNR